MRKVAMWRGWSISFRARIIQLTEGEPANHLVRELRLVPMPHPDAGEDDGAQEQSCRARRVRGAACRISWTAGRIVTGSLCGSTPMITWSITHLLAGLHPGQRGRATLLRAEQTLPEPRLATVPGRTACHEKATPRHTAGSREKSVPAGHLTRA